MALHFSNRRVLKVFGGTVKPLSPSHLAFDSPNRGLGRVKLKGKVRKVARGLGDGSCAGLF